MNQPQPLKLFATTPKGLELLLVEELRSLGAMNPAEKLAGVTFRGDLTLAYKACLWSRLANRILLHLHEFSAETPEALYAGVQAILWQEHLTADKTLAVHVVCSQSKINHTLFAAQKVKDAIVDQLRKQSGARPNVARDKPDVSVYVYIHRDRATVYLDLSGESLHKRGYRLHRVEAPLKENLAAAVLIRAGWPSIAKAGGTLYDPMCGSGTLLIEAAQIAGDIAPGLSRQYFGFLGWKQHQALIWKKLSQEAKTRAEIGIKTLPVIIGFDQDPEAIQTAFSNIDRAGFMSKIHVEKRILADFSPRKGLAPGLIVVNPPYGERLGEVEALAPLYTEMGDRFKAHFEGWDAAVLTGNPDLGKQMGLRAKKRYALLNGAISCQLLLFTIDASYFVDRSPEGENERLIRQAKKATNIEGNSALQAFINRLTKNVKHLKKQASSNYVLYDADLPDYAFQIEMIDSSLHVREYQAPRSIAEEKVLRRRHEVLAVLPDLLSVSPRDIYFTILPRD